MKVEYAQFFYNNDEKDLDVLSDICNILNIKRKKILYRDRFNYFNKFSRVDWIETEDSYIFENFKNYKFSDFKDLCLKEAENIDSLNKKINVLWSGGVDSTCVLAALLEVCDKNKIRIFTTPDCENKILLEKLKSNDLNVIVFEKSKMKKTIEKYDGIVVNGHPADQLFGCKVLTKFIPEYRKLSIVDALNKIKETGNIIEKEKKEKTDENCVDTIDQKTDIILSTEVEELFNHIIEYSKIFNIELRNFQEAVHLLNFGIRYSFINSHVNFDLPNKTNISFFSGKDFQQWFLNNFHEINELDSTNSLEYKKPLKDFIISSLKDDSILNIGKNGSYVYEDFGKKYTLYVKEPLEIKRYILTSDSRKEFIRKSIDIREKFYIKKKNNVFLVKRK